MKPQKCQGEARGTSEASCPIAEFGTPSLTSLTASFDALIYDLPQCARRLRHFFDDFVTSLPQCARRLRHFFDLRASRNDGRLYD